ncbi:MAG TPA: hypothetical protein VIC85_10255 [Ktedonobacterales bacterium]|jgi:hypothetical protein
MRRARAIAGWIAGWMRRHWKAEVAGVPIVLLAALTGVILVAASGTSQLRPPRNDLPAAFRGRATGFDISWPQCGYEYPTAPYSFGIIGVTGGRPYTQNPCLREEYIWALDAVDTAPSVYMNLDFPTPPPTGQSLTGSPPACRRDGVALCPPYTYGYEAARQAIAYAEARGVTAHVWWLDTETENAWSDDVNANFQAIRGALTALRDHGLTAGVYSTRYQWRQIAGANDPKAPMWVAGATGENPHTSCSPLFAFGSGKIWLTQFPNGNFDGDYVC